MLKIGVCDDSPDARRFLCDALERLLDRRGIAHQCLKFSSGEGLLGWLEKNPGKLELVFLDIEMPGVDGMETARRLRRAEDALQLVFVTGYSKYVYDGYAVGALGYLLKPPGEEQLDAIVTRALAALSREREPTFVCRSGETVYRIACRDILYFYSDRRLVNCVTPAGTYSFYGKLNDVEQTLAEGGFVRIHQSYLVRAGAVEQVNGSEVRIGGETLPVSRACRSAAMLALTRAMLN